MLLEKRVWLSGEVRVSGRTEQGTKCLMSRTRRETYCKSPLNERMKRYIIIRSIHNEIYMYQQLEWFPEGVDLGILLQQVKTGQEIAVTV